MDSRTKFAVIIFADKTISSRLLQLSLAPPSSLASFPIPGTHARTHACERSAWHLQCKATPARRSLIMHTVPRWRATMESPIVPLWIYERRRADFPRHIFTTDEPACLPVELCVSPGEGSPAKHDRNKRDRLREILRERERERVNRERGSRNLII